MQAIRWFRAAARACAVLLGVVSVLVAGPSLAAGDAVSDWCETMGRRLYSVKADACREMGFAPTGAHSVNGVPLMLRDIPPAPTRVSTISKSPPRAPRVLIIGGIHGDELTSVSIVFRWLQWVDEGDARNYHWRIAPVVNPDGLLASPAQRMNANGVDLNRNFPTPDWSRDARDYWERRTGRDPRRFPGAEPLSEPETRWMQEEIERFKPDVIVSIHAPYGILDYDGPAQEPNRFGKLRLNRLGVYPGSLGNFGGVYKGVPVITIELPSATRMPADAELRNIWRDMLAWMRKHIVPAIYS